MFSEEPKLSDSEDNDNNPSLGEPQASPQPTAKPGPTQRSTPTNMAAEDDEDVRPTGDVDFGQLLDQFEQEQATLQEGEVVRGTVVGISERGVVIDFGYKSEGIVNPAEFTEGGNLTVKPGDEVEVLVKSMETADGLPVLSQVDVRPVRNLDSLRNQEIEAKVIKLNRKRSNVVLSRKAVIEEQNTGRKDQTLQHIEEDIVVEGQIKNLTDYGAFVDLGGVDGLLHVTDMSWGRL